MSIWLWIIIGAWIPSGLLGAWILSKTTRRDNRVLTVGDLPDLSDAIMLISWGPLVLMIAIAESIGSKFGQWRDKNKERVIWRRGLSEDEILKEAEEILRRRID